MDELHEKIKLGMWETSSRQRVVLTKLRNRLTIMPWVVYCWRPPPPSYAVSKGHRGNTNTWYLPLQHALKNVSGMRLLYWRSCYHSFLCINCKIQTLYICYYFLICVSAYGNTQSAFKYVFAGEREREKSYFFQHVIMRKVIRRWWPWLTRI